jgi:hypothetical protein
MADTKPDGTHPMSMKKTDLEKALAKKIAGRVGSPGVAQRFGAGAADLPDRREQRRLDAAAGLVPFACKLPQPLLKQLADRAATHEGGLNALVAQLIEKGLA